jgi:hypothetical protein
MRAAVLPVAVLGPLLVALTLPPQPQARPAPPPAAPQEALVERVRKAIDDAVAFLKRQERGQGNWDTVGKIDFPGGATSLAMLALLNAGVPKNDPVIQRGLDYLRGVQPGKTYVVGLQTMVFCLADDPRDRQRIQKNVDWLEKACQRPPLPPPGAGPIPKSGWSYGSTGEPDNSNSQYALLGLHEARLAGARVDVAVLQAMRDFYIRSQRPGGGWNYRAWQDQRVSMTMTTAGLCNLLITGLDVEQGRQKLRPDGSAENCGVYDEQKPTAEALAWIGEHFPAQITRERAAAWGSAFYCLYGLERAGRLTGHRFFGGHDWYRLGCEFLVETQKEEGFWVGIPGQQAFDTDPIIATSFALLFLSKGRTPVLITKLAHNAGDDWNNKRSDVRHLVDFASRELFKKQPLAWQIFDVRQREARGEADNQQLAAELLASPIVWFNGHGLAPRDREEEILREYVGNGGFVMAEACCGSPQFDRDFRALVKRLFPDSELQRLTPDHPVWTASGKFAVSPEDFELWGVRQGCKTVLVYSPKPISGYWEANLSGEDQGRGRKAFELGANIIAYATGLEAPRPRLTEVHIERAAEERKVLRGYLEVAELAHDGDWSWPAKHMVHLMSELRADGLDVALRTRLAQLSPDVNVQNRADALMAGQNAPYHERVSDGYFFYLHGRRAFTWRDQALKDLRFRLVSGGGTLLADAACGAKPFDAGFRKFIDALFEGKHKLERIPPDDELFSRELNGTPITSVRCRREGPDGRVRPQLQEVPPELEGVKVNGRWVVVYSRYDLGCALEKHGSTSCLGHDYESAVRLGRAVVLYALKR